ncbi:MAG: queuosine precursor transporter, partial [Candidatus Poseidoniaceae archaeon]|nr:queuosine precursor transporter [Candidatus Poseidoniaceae archaeon]
MHGGDFALNFAGKVFNAQFDALAQFVDVRIFHFWKKLTNGKHLWLRNNGSTVASQLVDTTLVICILFVGVW